MDRDGVEDDKAASRATRCLEDVHVPLAWHHIELPVGAVWMGMMAQGRLKDIESLPRR